MFTGLIETIGSILLKEGGSHYHRLHIGAPEIAGKLKPGDSIAVNGACQPVTRPLPSGFTIECLAETLRKTTLGNLRRGSRVNLERAMKIQDRLDGHLVQGHIQSTGKILRIRKASQNIFLEIALRTEDLDLCIPEGSIAADGISLTLAEVLPKSVRLNIIPHTWENTTLRDRSAGDRVNIETDLIGRYLNYFYRRTPPEKSAENPLNTLIQGGLL